MSIWCDATDTNEGFTLTLGKNSKAAVHHCHDKSLNKLIDNYVNQIQCCYSCCASTARLNEACTQSATLFYWYKVKQSPKLIVINCNWLFLQPKSTVHREGKEEERSMPLGVMMEACANRSSNPELHTLTLEQACCMHQPNLLVINCEVGSVGDPHQYCTLSLGRRHSACISQICSCAYPASITATSTP